jgi:glyoxylase-like metal-dependent hydrolase (beta-lactamase superfamily II)
LLAALLAGCASTAPGADEQVARAGTPTATSAEGKAAAEAEPFVSRTDQAPGFMRMKLGEYTVTALYDGKVQISSQLLKGRPAGTIAQLLRQGRQPSDQGVQTAVNAFLLDDGKNVVLIDTGAADTMGADTGQLMASLAASGYGADDVTAVLLTHLHPDHAGGLLHQGEAAFPRAAVYVAKAEADFWLGEASAKAAPEAMQQYFAGARKAVAPYQQSSRFHTFAAGEQLLDGFSAQALNGHTPGHSGFVVKSGGETLLVWGDVVHSHTTQFADPAVALEFDVNQKQARATRIKAMQDAARSGTWVAGAHLPFPGIGRVLANGKAYRWLPLDYSQALSDASARQPGSGKASGK